MHLSRRVLRGHMAPGTRCSNLRFFGSKCTVLKKVLLKLLGFFDAPQTLGASRSDSAQANCELFPPLTHLVTPLPINLTRFWKFRGSQVCSAIMVNTDIHACVWKKRDCGCLFIRCYNFDDLLPTGFMLQCHQMWTRYFYCGGVLSTWFHL